MNVIELTIYWKSDFMHHRLSVTLVKTIIPSFSRTCLIWIIKENFNSMLFSFMAIIRWGIKSHFSKCHLKACWTFWNVNVNCNYNSSKNTIKHAPKPLLFKSFSTQFTFYFSLCKNKGSFFESAKITKFLNCWFCQKGFAKCETLQWKAISMTLYAFGQCRGGTIVINEALFFSFPTTTTFRIK